ncbi:MAG: Rieske 2Fe-2S domain-containing protein [Actinomycetota bacterium]|nr:Rieske 2Fe-2S domain-containing protein [Actinomycetota bacterium]
MPRQSDVTPVALSADEVLVSVGDKDFIIAAECPHRKGRLAYAHVNAATSRITCPLHKSTYDLATGCQVSGPAAGTLSVRVAPEPEETC